MEWETENGKEAKKNRSDNTKMMEKYAAIWNNHGFIARFNILYEFQSMSKNAFYADR
jgi:hypothetical protein